MDSGCSWPVRGMRPGRVTSGLGASGEACFPAARADDTSSITTYQAALDAVAPAGRQWPLVISKVLMDYAAREPVAPQAAPAHSEAPARTTRRKRHLLLLDLPSLILACLSVTYLCDPLPCPSWSLSGPRAAGYLACAIRPHTPCRSVPP